MRALSFTLFAVFCVASIVSRAQQGAASPAAARSAPTYTAAQAALGATAYAAQCAQCHGANLDDGAFGPPLKGVPFIQKYGGKSVDGLFDVTSTTMPTTAA